MDNVIVVSNDDEDEGKDVVNGDSNSESGDKADFTIVNSERPNERQPTNNRNVAFEL